MPDINGKPIRTGQQVTILQPDPRDKYHEHNGQSGIVVHVYPWENHGMAIVSLKIEKRSKYLLFDGFDFKINE